MHRATHTNRKDNRKQRKRWITQMNKTLMKRLLSAIIVPPLPKAKG